MNRSIVGFGQDDAGDWFARLDCGHRQHVRHNPPMSERPWVLSEEGRTAKLGQQLDCVRCDAGEWPEGFVAYKRTADFSDTTVPAGLTRNHATKAGVWGHIVVLEGRLRYTIEASGESRELDPTHAGIVVPEVRHHVEPLGAVRFYVEFHHAEPTGDD